MDAAVDDVTDTDSALAEFDFLSATDDNDIGMYSEHSI